MKKRVSLKDIADKVGVSVTLVSFVVNGKEKEGRVGKEIAQKIREVAKSMNYQPNYIARSLRNKNTQTIGLIVADISNPFFANLARIIEDEATSFNYIVIIGSSDEDPNKMKNILDFFRSRQVDGYIIVPTEGSYNQIKELKNNNDKYVLIDRHFESIPSNCVVIDNFQASFNATGHLISKGYKDIGVISYNSKLNQFEDRISGYKTALEENALKLNEKYIKQVNYSSLKEEICMAVSSLIEKEHVEAIYFTTNTIALEGLKCIFNMKLQIPDDIDVLAFDSSEAYNFFQYPIPHIIQPVKDMGIKAVKILMDHINGKIPTVQKIILEASLKI